jgi:exosortase O
VGGASLLPWWLGRLRAGEALTGAALVVVGVALAVFTTRRMPRDDDAAVPPFAARHTTTATTTATATAVAVAVALWGVGCVVLLAGVMAPMRVVQAAGVALIATAATTLSLPGRSLTTLMPPLLLVLLGLPLSGDVDVVGFPLRRLAAEGAAGLLPGFGVPVVPAETVLLTENGVADVEAPCAGLSTLRLLLAVVLVLASLTGARPARVALALGAVVGVAVLGNALRITALAWLVLGPQRTDLAGLLHVPLGVSVFLAAAAGAVLLLRPRGPAAVVDDGAPSWAATTRPGTGTAARVTTAIFVAGSVGVVAALLVLRAVPPTEATNTDGVLVARLQALSAGEPLPLGAAEAELFGSHALAARKLRLPDSAGEVLMVAARSLRAMHAPERCLAAHGHVVVDVADVPRAGLVVRRLLLDGGRAVGLSFVRSSATTATGPAQVAAARMRGEAGPWVFVSAVVAAGVDEDAVVAGLVADVDGLLRPATDDHRPVLPVPGAS